jgi:hypothetical protein
MHCLLQSHQQRNIAADYNPEHIKRRYLASPPREGLI